MIETAFLVARECAELLLVVWSLHACLVGARRTDLLVHLRTGTAVGVVAGLALVAVLVLGNLSPRADALLAIVLGLGVLFMAGAMLSSRTTIDGHVAGWFHDALDGRASPAMVFGFAALAAWRESAEVGVFIYASAPHLSALDIAGGVILGLALMLTVALAFRTLGARVPLLALYHLSSLLLCLIAIQLTLEGLGGLLASYPSLAGSWVARLLSPEGEAFGWLCALLMLGPLLVVARRWWTQAAPKA
ncbi:hypothetical protein CCO03_01820 [Comamonas serinivorans]|uniref:FTR1 family iron permease n=1 Tax=Comamonas serinivorans TaxID=1082851 RepID=A0A1Y0EJF3_9BURK|nr:hypothetical protein [Comamonas serinivorans]ARU03590.1 hypothetical protein CCO03_01820 [Comamonas serinivorans]